MSKRRARILVAATIFGILVWLSVAMREQYTITVTAPVTIENIPEGWSVSTPVPETIQLRLRGDGWRLAALLLGPEPHLRLPFTRSVTEQDLFSYPDIAERISLRPGIQLVDVSPDSIAIGLDRRVRRTVPVVFRHSITFLDDYGQVGPVLVTPESVTVEGAATVLQGIRSWPTEQRTFDRVKMPVDVDIPLASGEGAHVLLSNSSVHIRVNVQPFAEKVFSGVPVDVVALPSTREVILIPPKVEFVVRGGINQLTALSQGDFRVSVQYDAIIADTTGFVSVDIFTPDGIQLVRKRPDRLQYIVRKRL
jgi:hypothetical protein